MPSLVLDSDNVIRFWNRGAEELYGWSRGEAVGRPVSELLRTRFPVSSDEVGAALQAAGSWEGELAQTRRDGRDIVVASRRALRSDADGRLSTILEINRELTEQRRGEVARARLAAIVESSDDAIIGKTLDGVITSWNAAAERLYGYSRDEVVGRLISLLIPADRPDELPRILARLRRGERIEHYETQRITRDGRRLDISLSISPVRDASGAIVGAATIARDITLRKRAEAERAALLARERTARQEAEAAVRARDEFLSIAAHELRTPLTTLQAPAQLLLRQLGGAGGLDQARVERSLRAFAEQTGKLARLISQLLDVSRIEAGKLTLERRLTDLAELAASTAATVGARTDRALIAVQAPGSVWATVDPLRLEQVLTNLLDNAVRYSPADEPIEVVLRTGVGSWEQAVGDEVAPSSPDPRSSSPSSIEIAVRDRGLGIPPERRSRIFERFYQAHQDTHSSGMGLGLYVSRQIVELHGGEIRAEFPPDGGTRFVIRLPGDGRQLSPVPADG